MNVKCTLGIFFLQLHIIYIFYLVIKFKIDWSNLSLSLIMTEKRSFKNKLTCIWKFMIGIGVSVRKRGFQTYQTMSYLNNYFNTSDIRAYFRS